jgi:hypothetical protein
VTSFAVMLTSPTAKPRISNTKVTCASAFETPASDQ